MFLKTQKKGSNYYATVVKNNRVNGKVVQSVVLYLGVVEKDQIPYLKAAYENKQKRPKLMYKNGDIYDPSSS